MVIDKEIIELACCYKLEVRKFGRKFSFPYSTDITETYAYRYFESFKKNCEKYGLNINECKDVIRSIIKYADHKKILNNGVALISRKDIIKICYNDIIRDKKALNNTIKSIKECNNNLNIVCSIEDRYKYLIKKIHRHAVPNLVSMINLEKLNNSFMSISKSCMKAIKLLQCEYKNDLPSVCDLFKIRNRLINKIDNNTLSDILGVDFNVKI